MAIQHHGDAKNVTWGAGSGLSSYGILQRLTTSGSGVFADLKNENGQITGKTHYDGSDQVTADLIMKTGATKPTIGASVTVDTETYLCEGVTVTAENENYTQLSLTLTKYENLTLG